jgi:hypothetical protein
MAPSRRIFAAPAPLLLYGKGLIPVFLQPETGTGTAGGLKDLAGGQVLAFYLENLTAPGKGGVPGNLEIEALQAIGVPGGITGHIN